MFERLVKTPPSVDREALLSFLHAIYAFSRPGELYLDTPENIETSAASISGFLETMRSSRRQGEQNPAVAERARA